MTKHKSLHRLLASTVVFFGLYSAANADVLTGQSAATDLGITVTGNLLNLLSLGVSVGTGTTSGTAPAPYNNSGSLATATLTTNLLQTFLNANVLPTTAQSNVTGSGATGFATASASVASLNAFTDPLLLLVFPGLSISASTIQSTATVSGSSGSLTGNGATDIVNLRVDGVLYAAVTAATTIATDIAGITIDIDKQVATGNGSTSEGLTVDALDINFNNVLDLGETLNGDIIIAQSEAELTASPLIPPPPTSVPEPGTLAILGSGLIGLFLATRRQRTC